jgi:hypothetical protein
MNPYLTLANHAKITRHLNEGFALQALHLLSGEGRFCIPAVFGGLELERKPAAQFFIELLFWYPHAALPGFLRLLFNLEECDDLIHESLPTKSMRHWRADEKQLWRKG